MNVDILKKYATHPAVTGGVGLTAGLGLGYILGRIVRKKAVEDAIDERIEYIKETLSDQELHGMIEARTGAPLIGDDEELVTADDISDEAVVLGEITSITQDEDGHIVTDGKLFPTWNDLVDEYHSNTEDDPEDPAAVAEDASHEAEVHNIWNSAPPVIDWDWDAEMAVRESNDIYILRSDEFFANEHGHEQTTLTYYEGDDILTDENDVPIARYEAVVGKLRFGYGSGDQNVVYIRNTTLDSEFEVLLHRSTYASEVLGLEVEESLQHSNYKTPKFKME